MKKKEIKQKLVVFYISTPNNRGFKLEAFKKFQLLLKAPFPIFLFLFSLYGQTTTSPFFPENKITNQNLKQACHSIWKVKKPSHSILHIYNKAIMSISPEITEVNAMGFFIGPHHFLTSVRVIKKLLEHNDPQDIKIIKNQTPQRIKIKKVSALFVPLDLVILETYPQVKTYLNIRKTAFKKNENLFVWDMSENTYKKIEIHKFERNNQYPYMFHSPLLKNVTGSPILDSSGKVIGVVFNSSKKLILLFNKKILELLSKENTQSICSSGNLKQCIEKKRGELYEKAEQNILLAQFLLGQKYLLESKNGKINYTQAVHWLEKAAKKNLAPAQQDLANIYMLGFQGVKKSYKKAFELYKQAAQSGYTPAQYSLAEMYYSGWGTKKDLEQAIYWYQKAGDQNYIPAQRKLVKIYGEKTEVYNNNLMVYWLRKAADNQDMESMYALGEMYLSGQVKTNKKFEDSTQLFLQAARQGHPQSQYILASIYSSQMKNTFDSEQVLYWLEQAAKNNHTLAQVSMAIIYFTEKKDYKKAAYWYNKAAQNGNTIAQYHLAEMYYLGVDQKQNSTQAAYWLQQAAKKDHTKAQVLLAKMYFSGKGVERNILRALYWLRKGSVKDLEAKYQLGKLYYSKKRYLKSALIWSQAAKLGHIKSQLKLIQFYYSQKEHELAIYWLSNAAHLGHVESQFQLAQFYYSQKKYKIALNWWLSAAKLGHPKAQFYIAYLYYYDKNIKEKQDIAGMYWLKRSAENNYAPAQTFLAYMYYIKENYSLAAEWYQKAAEQEYFPAQFQLAFMYGRGIGVKKNINTSHYWLEKANAWIKQTDKKNIPFYDIPHLFLKINEPEE